MKRLIIIISLFNFYIVTAMAVTKADADSSYVNENYQQAISQYEELIKELGAKINDIILVIIGCVLFSSGCRLASTQIRPVLPNGMPLIALVVLMIGASMLIYALKRILKKKK